MRRWILVVTTALFAAALFAAPTAIADSGAGELGASFNAGLSGGIAIDIHSEIADQVASPQVNPEGRLEPFGGTEYVCDEQVVGTWVFILDDDRALLDAWTNEFKLDGEVLDTVRTPIKRYGDSRLDSWWFAEGVPVLGVLDPGLHTIEWTFDDGFGGFGTILTSVEVDSAYC